MPRATIHLKVMLLIGAALCLLLAITGYFALQNERRFLEPEAEKRVLALRRALEALTRLALTTGEEGPLRDYLLRLAAEDRDVHNVQIFDRNGKILYVTGSAPTPTSAAPVQTSAIYIDGRYAGRVEITFNAESLRSLLGRMTWLILASLIDCLLFLGLLLHLALKHFVTRPLDQFIAASNRIAAGDFGATIQTGTRDELADLASAFNEMSASLALFRSELESSNRLLEERVRQRTAELESEMARAQELSLQVQHADRLSSLGTLAAGVAHELNNPLGNINTFVQLLLEKPEVPREVLARCLKNLSQETDRASRIVRKLLEFSRRQPASVQPVALPSLVAQALSLLETSLRDSKIEVRLELPETIPNISVDSSGIVQVLVNLMTNAMHAMPGGGRLTIAASLEGEHVKLTLADTGVGIAPEHLGRVFDPFFTTKDVGKGTGLGLSVSYGIVRDHGGRIGVSSRPGDGTVFEVLLPVSRAEAVTQAA